MPSQKLNVFDGGHATRNPGSAMYPTFIDPAKVDNEATQGKFSYADHQRARYYVVTKHLDFNPPRQGDIGGNGSPALYQFYQERRAQIITDTGVDLVTHFLLPNTVVKSITLGFVKKGAGAVSVAVDLGTEAAIAATAAADGKVIYYQVPADEVVLLSGVNYVTAKVTGVAAAGLDGLEFWVAVEALDLNHGNVP